MEQLSFFDREEEQPLASRLRPRTLEEYVGQTIFWDRARSYGG